MLSLLPNAKEEKGKKTKRKKQAKRQIIICHRWNYLISNYNVFSFLLLFVLPLSGKNAPLPMGQKQVDHVLRELTSYRKILKIYP